MVVCDWLMKVKTYTAFIHTSLGTLPQGSCTMSLDHHEGTGTRPCTTMAPPVEPTKRVEYRWLDSIVHDACPGCSGIWELVICIYFRN